MRTTSSSQRGNRAAHRAGTSGRFRRHLVAMLALTAPLLDADRLPAAVFPATLIAQEGDTSLVGADGLAVADLSYPVTTSLGALGFNGRLDTGEGFGDGFVWFDGEVVWRTSEWGPGLLGASSRGFSEGGGWLSRVALDGAAALWTHNGLLQRVGEQVPWAHDVLTVRQIALEGRMSDAGAAYWRVEVSDSEGRRYWIVLRSRTAVGGDIELEVAPDAWFGGHPMSRPWGVTDFDVSRDQKHRIYGVTLEVEGSKRATAVVDGAIVAMQAELTGGLPGERWYGTIGRKVTVNGVGAAAFAALTDAPGRPWVVAHSGPRTGDAAAKTARIVLREGDCVGTQGAPSPCVVLPPDTEPRTVALSEAGGLAHLWIEAGMSGADEYLFYSCDPARPLAATLLVSRHDLVDLDGDGVGDAIVDRVGLPGEQQVAFGLGTLYVGAELRSGSGTIEAILELALPVCAADGG